MSNDGKVKSTVVSGHEAIRFMGSTTLRPEDLFAFNHVFA